MEIQNYSQFCWHSLTGVAREVYLYFRFFYDLYLATFKLKLLATMFIMYLWGFPGSGFFVLENLEKNTLLKTTYQ